ncbi:YciI-like protein [Mangrovicella endophytica]|uniref:YciI-like protein n=1 Tax=Mangrovicella endophytica TaxID=2066697 RepID=UPI000C9E7911|nr:YciI-like protein [Mangrovicella endophytica]
MLFALICEDKPNSVELRMNVRPAHVEHLKGLGPKLKFAGPFLNDDEKPVGSLVMIDAADRAEAQAIAERDPYAQAGLFASVTVQRWNWALNNPDAA